MNDKYDLERLIAEAKAGGKDIPLLGQQVPALNGLPLNNGILTIDQLEKFSDREFKELFIATVISLLGAVYVPPSAVPDTPPTESASATTEDIPVEEGMSVGD